MVGFGLYCILKVRVQQNFLTLIVVCERKRGVQSNSKLLGWNIWIGGVAID